MRSWWVGLVALSMLTTTVFPGVIGGTEEVPEVTDPGGDGGPNGRDIVKIWFEQPDPDNVVAHFALNSALGTQTIALLAQQERWTVFFKPTTGKPEAAAECYLAVRWGQGQGPTTTTNGYFGCAGAGVFANIAGERAMAATAEGTSMSVTLPLYHLPGFRSGVDSFNEPYGRVVVLSKGPVNGTAPDSINNIIREWDRAPNTGFGTGFQGLGVGAVASDFNISGPAEPVEVPSGGSATTMLNFSTPSATPVNLTLSLNSTDANLSVDFDQVEIMVPANGSASVNLTIESTGAAGTTTSFIVNATSADGTSKAVTIDVTVTAAPEPSLSASPSGSPSPTTNTTASNQTIEPKDAGIPGLGAFAVLLMMLLTVVAIRRRRVPRA